MSPASDLCSVGDKYFAIRHLLAYTPTDAQFPA